MKILTVILLWFAGLAAATQFAKIAVPFSLIREIYPGSGTGAGWLLTIVSLVGAVLGLVASRWVLKLGAKRMLLASLVIGSIISLLQSTFPPFLSMLFLRTLEGMSHLVIVITAPALISSVSDDKYRGLAMSFWSTFFGVSFAVVGWLGMPLIEAYGLGFLFQLHGVVMLGIALLVAYAVVELPQVIRSKPGQALNLFHMHKQAYASPWISAPAAGWFAMLGLVQGASFSSIPELMPETKDQVLAYGLVAQAGNAGNLLGTPVLLAIAASAGNSMLYLSIAGFYALAIASHLMLMRSRIAQVSRSC